MVGRKRGKLTKITMEKINDRGIPRTYPPLRGSNVDHCFRLSPAAGPSTERRTVEEEEGGGEDEDEEEEEEEEGEEEEEVDVTSRTRNRRKNPRSLTPLLSDRIPWSLAGERSIEIW